MKSKLQFSILIVLFLFFLSSCAVLPASFESGKDDSVTVYEQIGGGPKIAEIVDNFIFEIEFSADIFPFFENSDVSRFREKLIEHICMLTGGPCKYTGDTMAQVHAGMDITEREFNIGVDLFINAMDKAEIPHTLQNKVLATITHTRKDIIYQ